MCSTPVQHQRWKLYFFSMFDGLVMAVASMFRYHKHLTPIFKQSDWGNFGKRQR